MNYNAAPAAPLTIDEQRIAVFPAVAEFANNPDNEFAAGPDFHRATGMDHVGAMQLGFNNIGELKTAAVTWNAEQEAKKAADAVKLAYEQAGQDQADSWKRDVATMRRDKLEGTAAVHRQENALIRDMSAEDAKRLEYKAKINGLGQQWLDKNPDLARQNAADAKKEAFTKLRGEIADNATASADLRNQAVESVEGKGYIVDHLKPRTYEVPTKEAAVARTSEYAALLRQHDASLGVKKTASTHPAAMPRSFAPFKPAKAGNAAPADPNAAPVDPNAAPSDPNATTAAPDAKTGSAAPTAGDSKNAAPTAATSDPDKTATRAPVAAKPIAKPTAQKGNVKTGTKLRDRVKSLSPKDITKLSPKKISAKISQVRKNRQNQKYVGKYLPDSEYTQNIAYAEKTKREYKIEKRVYQQNGPIAKLARAAMKANAFVLSSDYDPRGPYDPIREPKAGYDGQFDQTNKYSKLYQPEYRKVSDRYAKYDSTAEKAFPNIPIDPNVGPDTNWTPVSTASKPGKASKVAEKIRGRFKQAGDALGVTADGRRKNAEQLDAQSAAWQAQRAEQARQQAAYEDAQSQTDDNLVGSGRR